MFSGEDDPLQAVVIADNFSSKFAPALDEIPLCLLPVAGVPLIDYTLESLAGAGVNETFLFCSSRPDQIKAHIRNAQNDKAAWSVTMTVHIIVSEDCQSFGDALRDLDAKGLVNGHFVLVGADTVSNVQLIPLMEKHRETCKRDKGAAMTLVFKTAAPDHRMQRGEDPVLLATDANTKRVLSHRKLAKDAGAKIHFPIEIFLDHADVEIHHDLLDTQIAICSPSVLPLFADNFDFQTRDDFVKGILMNEEILASTIYWHRLQGDQYAARVANWQLYQTISQDIMHRWVYPLVPDMNISHQNKCTLLKNHVYQHADVKMAKVCNLEEFVVLSSGCSIGEGSFITRSVIGKNCIIGANCHIADSFLMDNCTLGDGCTVIASVLSLNCKVKRNVTMNSVILGSGVQLDEGVELKENLVKREPTSGSSQKVGNSAYLFDIQSTNDNESIDSGKISEENLPEVTLPVATTEWRDEESIAYSSSSEDESSRSESPIQEDTNLFLHEVIDSLARGYEEKLKCDYLILEINSSRYAYNMSLQEVNFYVVQALFNLPPMTSTTNVVATFKDLYKYFTPIISNYIKGASAMSDCLNAIEDCCDKNDILAARVAQVIHLLYENDVISEDTIMEWYGKVMNEKRALSKNTGLKKFIDWLEEASEESNED